MAEKMYLSQLYLVAQLSQPCLAFVYQHITKLYYCLYDHFAFMHPTLCDYVQSRSLGCKVFNNFAANFIDCISTELQRRQRKK